MKVLQLRRALIFALFSFALFHAFFFYRLEPLIMRGYSDFAAFYTAGKILRSHESGSLYDLARQWQVQQEFASSVKIRSSPLPYIRPPFEALLFLPFAYLKYSAAIVVWTGLQLALLFLVPFLLVSGNASGSFSLPRPWLQGLLCLGFYPVAFDLIQGQDSIILLLLLTLAFTSFRRGLEFRSGIYLAVGLFKFHLVIPLFIVLLLKRRYKAVAGFLSAAFALLLISVALVGWPGLISYSKYLSGLNRTPLQMGINSSVMPNIRGLLTPFLGRQPVPPALIAALLLVSFLGMIISVRIWRSDEDSLLTGLGFSFCIVFTLVTSYYTTSHDLVLLILPLLLTASAFASGSPVRGWPRALFLGSTALLLCSPLDWLLLLSLNAFFIQALLLLALALSLAATVNRLSRRASDPAAMLVSSQSC
jgi:Glycosyltransferase family 87